jgi:hypothetical protein
MVSVSLCSVYVALLPPKMLLRRDAFFSLFLASFSSSDNSICSEAFHFLRVTFRSWTTNTLPIMELDYNYDTFGPNLPSKFKDPEALAEEIKSTPLFMSSFKQDDFEDNDVLAALQSLAYDGTPEGIVPCIRF